MTIKTILVDPDNNYEIVVEPEESVARFNANEPNPDYHMTVQDQIDINIMFVEQGLLQFVNIH